MYIVYKNIGETPLESLEKLRIREGIQKGVPMTYAGRLDPMAEGLLIVLIGNECKEKNKYTNLDKEYEVEILIGIRTDSHDILGFIQDVKVDEINDENDDVDVIDFKKFEGKFLQKYPRYSSKIIAMKELPEEMPTREVEIYSIHGVDERTMTSREIVNEVLEKVSMVKGDFRQDKIILEWKNFMNKHENGKFKIIKIRVVCSSGTYMRSLAHNMGGLAYSIKRTKIGQYYL